VSIALDSTALTSQSKDAPDFAGYNLLIGSIRMRFNDARASNLAWVSEARPETVGERRLQTFEVTLQAVVLSGQIKQMAITFDLATSLPVHMIMRDAKGRLVVDYDWQNLRLGVGLTDADFRFETPK
jgi:outer membrane lipoprotein-sorting protein